MKRVLQLRLNVKAHLTTIGVLEERLKAVQARCDVLEHEVFFYFEELVVTLDGRKMGSRREYSK